VKFPLMAGGGSCALLAEDLRSLYGNSRLRIQILYAYAHAVFEGSTVKCAHYLDLVNASRRKTKDELHHLRRLYSDPFVSIVRYLICD
jgi:hypothetical protein